MMGVTNGETIVQVGSESINIEGNLGNFTNESSSVDAVCEWSGLVDCRDKSCGNPIQMAPENDMVGGCSPQQCPDKHATLGTNTYIDANDVPHMICHGTTDNIVPSCEGEIYANNLKQAGVYVEWYNPGHGHNVNGDYTDEMIKFFNATREAKQAQTPEQPEGTGLEQTSAQEGSLYFVNNILSWTIDNGGEYVVSDLTGNVMCKGDANDYSVNLSNFASGVYIVTFYNNKTSVSYKILKQ